MSTNKSNSLFLKPKRKNRPAPKKIPQQKDCDLKSIRQHSRLLSRIDNNSQLCKQTDKQPQETMITRNRITTQVGIFNMAKMSKTVSRGPLTAQNETSMMDQDDSSLISRVICQTNNQSMDQSIPNQDVCLMEISKIDPQVPEVKKPLSSVRQLSEDSAEQITIPFKEIEHNLLHDINSQDYLKKSNTLSLIKRDLHATIKRNIPHEIYLQFFKKAEAPPLPLPLPPSNIDKKPMPLQPSHLANLPNSQDRKMSEWTMLMGTFSSQEDEDNKLAMKADSKKNLVSMMDTDVSLSQQSLGYDTCPKPDYLDSPSPVTMYPHKMF